MMAGMSSVRALIRQEIEKRPDLPAPAHRKQIREGAGLPQQVIADAIGVTRPMISLYESGARNPSGEVRERYAEALEEMSA